MGVFFPSVGGRSDMVTMYFMIECCHLMLNRYLQGEDSLIKCSVMNQQQ